MERRSFFKMVGTASGAALTGACGKPAAELLPILVPEEQIVPGVEEWHPSVCRECTAGCGVIVRVMEAHHKLERDGESVLHPIAAIKKVEGNPLDPVSGGRLCGRGQASVQRLYHPDRLRGPKKRTGDRGAAELSDADWDEAHETLASLLRQIDPARIVWLTRAESSSRSATVARFLDALGASAATTVGVNDFSVERAAAKALYGWDGLPVYEIQDADFVLSLGADFLGGWTSPVLYARRFGHFRQGRPQTRGTLIHAESRLSQTGWAADRWLPVAPGGEQDLAVAIGNLLIEEHGLGKDVGEAFRAPYTNIDLAATIAATGVSALRVRETAAQLAAANAPLVVAGASIVRTNSVAAVGAASGLNVLLGNVGKPGGVKAPTTSPFPRPKFSDPQARLEEAEIVFVEGVDPLYLQPALKDALAGVETVVSFASMVDETAAFADWVLPDHDALESAAAVVPEVAPGAALTGAASFVRPLYDTRPVEETLSEIAKRLEKGIDHVTAHSAYEDTFAALDEKDEWDGPLEFADYAERQGGWWSDAASSSAPEAGATVLEAARFEGSESDYPLTFQPYFSSRFGDGSGAALPWLQETPDPTSSAMWEAPMEIDPGTAAAAQASNGDLFRIETSAGSIQAPVYVNPAAIPGVVSMAIGQGHQHLGRDASGRGTNPLAVVAEAAESQTGVLAFGATRCRLSKAGDGTLRQFSIVDRETEPVRL